MTDPVQVRLTSSVESIAAFVRPYIGWIEEQLGTSYSRTLTLEMPMHPGDAAAEELFAGASLYRRDSAGWRAFIAGWEVPPGLSPRIQLSRCRERKPGKAPITAWSLHWQECPISLRLRGVERPIVLVNVPVGFPGDHAGGAYSTWLIVRREDTAAVLAVFDAVTGGESKYVRGTCQRVRLAPGYDWDALVLDATITRMLRRDFELFFEREAWFRQHGLPFRRGYLLYGLPGNGKTSVVRVMASHPLIEAHTLDFSEDTDNNDLYRLFDAAQHSAPALIILEDLDRIFPRETRRTRERKVSFHALLSCLDGIGTQDGIVVVATANDATALDPAILQRPGRFDRVVAFPAPDVSLRRQYFLKLNTALAGEGLETAVAEAEGFSFAQLRESYVLAGQSAFDEGRKVTVHDLVEAVRLQRYGAAEVKNAGPGTPVGFRAEVGTQAGASLERCLAMSGNLRFTPPGFDARNREREGEVNADSRQQG